MIKNNFKAGLFVLLTLILLVFMILKVSQGGLFHAGDYTLYMDVPSAVGLDKNTPIQVAGVTVGTIDDIRLTPSNLARLKLSIRPGVKINSGAQGILKQTGILGDAYVDLVPGPASAPLLKAGDVISDVSRQGDLMSVTGQFSMIADDVQAITKQMKKVMAGDDSSFAVSMHNIEKITTSLSQVMNQNQDNINVIIANMKVISQNLNTVISHNMEHVNGTLANVDNITTDINNGKGTIGRLLKDDETIEKINDTLDSVKDFVGGASRLTVDMGAHSEYLAGTQHFKNYVSLALKPRPDKYFLFEVSSDPDPSYTTTKENTTVVSGGTTNTIDVTKQSKTLGAFQISAELAKKFQNATFRGGLIESTGGLGFDYDQGPLGVQFSAFDFKTDYGQRPHLKAMGTLHVTPSFYLLSGLDDFINPDQDLDWFFGGGLNFTDDDIKSLLGLFTAASAK